MKGKAEYELEAKSKGFDEAVEQFATKEGAMQKKIKNLENDLKVTFKNHKKNLSDLEEAYKHEEYKERYQAVLAENQSLWSEIGEARGLVGDIEAMSKQQQETNRLLAGSQKILEQSESLLSFLFLLLLPPRCSFVCFRLLLLYLSFTHSLFHFRFLSFSLFFCLSLI